MAMSATSLTQWLASPNLSSVSLFSSAHFSCFLPPRSLSLSLQIHLIPLINLQRPSASDLVYPPCFKLTDKF
jgi:hypothetical protein